MALLTQAIHLNHLRYVTCYVINITWVTEVRTELLTQSMILPYLSQ